MCLSIWQNIMSTFFPADAPFLEPIRPADIDLHMTLIGFKKVNCQKRASVVLNLQQYVYI